jgi:ATP-dependent Lhr-like helicase
MLDELTTTGEVLWSGHGTLPGTDGWVSLHLADSAHLTLPDHAELESTPLHDAVLEALGGGGAYFFRQLSDAAGSTDDKAMEAALWDLVWAGRLSNDTLAPVRALTSGRRTAHRSRRPPPRGRMSSRPRRADLPTRTGPPTVAGRWSLLPELEQDPTRRAHASAEGLLERHGVVTRGAVTSERVPGGFAGVYKVLSAFEDSGRCRRGYFIGSLGAAQFGVPGAVDRLRSFSKELSAAPVDPWDTGAQEDKRTAIALAATDPANPYGAALPWPERPVTDESGAGHRPGRKAGALVVLVDGALAVYVERGGKTLLTFTEEPDALSPAMSALATAVRRGALGRLTVERADGASILGAGERSGALRMALEGAGFVATPRGLRLRA